ncbi:MAG: hypothetical protein ACNI3A_18755 [Desulfovibrio sp.]|uniref:hypothetical protein n=1 Tax=Desulfovibrio sp. 7SRBS1 TaxID=3378064 RepID=UPI003B3C6138
MAGNSTTLNIEIQVDDKGSLKIRQFGKEVETAGQKGSKSFGAMSSSAKHLNTQADLANQSLMRIAKRAVGLGASYLALAKLKGAAADWVNLANIQEGAENRLGATLRATGNAAGYNLAQLKAMASGIQEATTAGDELTLSGMSVLATFKQVRGEAFERATMAALDMATVMGNGEVSASGLNSTMVQLGKALNDPISGLSSLSRVGVTFTEGQKAQIKSLVETGNVMAAQMVILRELESEFGGAAAAATKNFAGAQTQAANALGDTEEELGFVITKNQFFIDLMGLAKDRFVEWGTWIQNNRQFLMELAKDGVLLVADSIVGTIRVIEVFHQGWNALKLAGVGAVDGLLQALNYLIEGFRYVLTPIDLLFDGLVKLGQLDVNPFDSALQSVREWQAGTSAAVDSVITDMMDTARGYDTAANAVRGVRDEIAKIPVTQAEATEQTRASIHGVLDTVTTVSKERLKAEAALTKETAKLTKKKYEYELWALEEEKKALKQKGVDSVKLDEWYAAKAADITKRRLKEETEEIEKSKTKQESLHQKMVKGFEYLDEKYWDIKKRKLREQYDYAQQHVEDKKALEVWYSQELYQLDRERNDQRLKASEAEYERRAYYADDYFTFMQAKIGEELVVWTDAHSRQQMLFEQTWTSMKEFGRDAMSALGDTAGDMLFDAIKGDMKSLEDYWESFWDSLLSTMTRTVTDMAAAWATSQLIDFGANFIGGFLSSYHTGAIRLTQDEIVAKLLKNETVIPPKQSLAIDAAMNGGGLSKSEYFDKMTGYVQAGAALDFSYDTQDPDVAGMGVSNALSSLTAGIAAGVSNFTSIMGQAEKLKDTGLNIDMGKARGFAFDYAMAGVASGVVGGFLGNMIGDVGSYYLGVSEYAPYAKILNTAIASVLGIPGPAGLLAAALSPVTALAVAAVADAFDLRDQETFKDAMESKYGWSKGLRMTQAMQEYAAKTLGAEFAGMGWADDISGLNLDVPSVELQGGVVQPGETVVMTPIAAKDLLDPAKVQQTFNALSDGLNEYRSREARDRYGEYGGKLSGGWNDSGGHHDGSEGHNVGGEKGSSTGTGGGYNDGHGGVSGLAQGGVVDRLVVPTGDDGFAALTLGEGVVSRDGMELLARINSGDAVTLGSVQDWRDSAKSQLVDALEVQTNLLQTQLTEQEKLRDQFERYSVQMRDARIGNWTNDSLTILSPTQQYALQRNEFEQLARRARLGDTDAIEKLTSVSTDFLQSSKDTNSNWSAYRSDFLLVQQTLADVEMLSTRHATSAESQAELLRAQLTTSQEELNTLKGISTQIVTLAQARTEYQSAQNALQQAASATGTILESNFDAAAYRQAKYAKLVADGKYSSVAEAAAGYAQNQSSSGLSDYENYLKWGKGHVPGFARGGYHVGGLRLVGETGPELEVTGPAQYFSTGQTTGMVGVWDRMLDSMLSTRSEIAELRLDLEAMGSSIITELQLMRDVLEKWDRTGLPRERAA